MFKEIQMSKSNTLCSVPTKFLQALVTTVQWWEIFTFDTLLAIGHLTYAVELDKA